MTLHRFFVPPETIHGGWVKIDGDIAHQIRNVLRLRKGDKIVLLDNTSAEHTTAIQEIGSTYVVGEVQHSAPSSTEPRTHISLYQAVLKARNLEWTLQKGTELGVAEFIPIICDRSIVGDLQGVDRKHSRWEKILREAAEQSRRGRIPLLLPAMMFAQACQRVAASRHLNIILWEEEKSVSLKAILGRWQKDQGTSEAINLFVGPEGGFAEEEIELAQQYTLQPASLGPRILRAETAGLVAAASIFYELEG
jgi:16S rRNA (uracil1498-N3)-methyltransferase